MKPKLFRKGRIFGYSISLYKIAGLMAQGIAGFYCQESKTITIDGTLVGEDMEQTVLHEMFHAHLDRVHAQQQMSPEFAEIVVENLARCVVDNYHLRWKK